MTKQLEHVCIAEMMGIKPIKGVSKHDGKDYYYYNDPIMQDYEALPDYSNSWCHLMPVVEKINKRDWVTIFSDECKIHSLIVGEFETIKITLEGEPLINSVYQAVLKYAQWYSKNFKKNKIKITYLGKELDTTKEHEILSKNDFGFKVDIKYTEESWYTEKFGTAYNCTEVHHLWSLDYMGGASIAFESDIHSTGFTRRIDTIESVNIELADKLFESY